MSDEALRIYEQAQRNQHNRNEARRIRTRVNEARKSPQVAGTRWPFELLQNAVDAGPRPGCDTVTVALRLKGRTLAFEHDGAPFNSQELAALLSGGSSKEFESEETTGRFGTGFLVTHVLAQKTSLDGLLAIGSGFERFQLILDRAGDEEAILSNIYACNDAIRAAVPVLSVDGAPSATFEYVLDSDDPLELGLESLRDALPYLYGTQFTLGRTCIQARNGDIEEWNPGYVTTDEFPGGIVYFRDIRISTGNDSLSKELRILRVVTGAASHAAALVLLRKEGKRWSVIVPGPGRPRIYREYPLRESGFLPINFVLDGKFDPDQERSRLLMSEEDKRLVHEALNAAALAVVKGIGEEWLHSHLLACASDPKSAFLPHNEQERKWWTAQLALFATQLATKSIVETGKGLMPAAPRSGEYTDFVVPRLSATSRGDQTSVERMWPLVVATENLLPPVLGVAADWTRTAQGWSDLGVKLDLITLESLAESVRPKEPLLAAIKVEGDKRHWLALFIDVVGECLKVSGAQSGNVLNGLVPDQAGGLASPDALMRDAAVTNELKDVCEAMGFNVRASLLDSGLLDLAESLNLKYLVPTLAEAVSQTASERDIIERCLRHVEVNLPKDGDYGASNEVYLHGSIRLLDNLSRSLGRAAESLAKRLPFVATDNAIVSWSRDRMMMAPVRNWPDSAQRFWTAYPPDRVLIDAYAGVAELGIPNVAASLESWGIAYAEPITETTPTELKERRLAAITRDRSQSDGVTVSGHQFSQIALLHPELINRCSVGVNEARALLGLVLCHVAPNDACWVETREVVGKKAGREVSLSVRGALWLADLNYRAWVPVQDPDGKSNQMTASAATLQPLLDPSWLEHNDAAVTLLSKWFGFDELELRLLGTAPDSEKRKALRDGLARLVECAGSDLSVYEALARDIETRRNRARDIARYRKLGFSIQDAIKDALEARDLKVTLIDRGYDFDVVPETDHVLIQACGRVEIGPYLLEVKATTTGQARMTPTQAATARSEAARYVLCVVDLSGVAEDRLDGKWTAADAEPIALIITDIGAKVRETCEHIDRARESEIAIRNDQALRYEVPAKVWRSGVSITEWVEQIWQSLKSN